MWKKASEMDKLLTKKWVKMEYWYGNPELGYDCWGKRLKNCNVYVFGKKDQHKEIHQITDFNFVVRSNFTGMFKADSTAEELMAYIDFRGELGILSHGRSLTEKELQQFYSQINEKQKI